MAALWPHGLIIPLDSGDHHSHGEGLHIRTLQNHIILMRMQMQGKLWEIALDELLVKNVFLGGAVAEGLSEPSSLVHRANSIFWRTCVGWHLAKPEGSTSSLICLLLLVLIQGI